MSALAIQSPRAFPLRLGLARFGYAEPHFLALGLLLLAAMLPTAFAMSLDIRVFNGIDVWDKPLKFEFALAVYALTLALFAAWLPARTTAKRWYRIYVGAVIAAILAETIWIAGAAAIGVASHFNTTPLGTVIFGFMGAFATLLTSTSAVYAFQIARNRDTGLPPVVKEAIVIGLALVLPLTLLTAGTMSARGSHWIGGLGSDANGLMLLGWARDGGDLRVAHFLATHAMHFLPLSGIVSLFVWGGERKIPFRIASAGFVGLVLFAYVQALLGQPFLPMLGNALTIG